MGSGRGQTRRALSASTPTIDRLQLAEVGSTVRHCGDCGDLLLHEPSGIIWWVAGDADGEGYTHPKKIIERFLAVPGVNTVLVEAENSPEYYEDEATSETQTITNWDQLNEEERELEVPTKGWERIAYPMFPPGSLLERASNAVGTIRPRLEKAGEFMTYFYINENTGELVVFPNEPGAVSAASQPWVRQELERVDGVNNVLVLERDQDRSWEQQQTYSEDELWVELW